MALQRVPDNIMKLLEQQIDDSLEVNNKKYKEKRTKQTSVPGYWNPKYEVGDTVREKFKPFKKGVITKVEITNVGNIKDVQIIRFSDEPEDFHIAKHFVKI